MFNSQPTSAPDTSTETERLLTALASHKPESPEYAKILDNLSKLDSFRRDNTPKPVDSNTKAQIAANLAGILLVINHERANILASKAMSMLPKLR